MGIFNIDNKFFRALNKLVDMVILSFCWIITVCFSSMLQNTKISNL